MALNKDSNGYVFGFAAVLVIVVGAGLASLAMALKPMQKANVEKEKMMNILQALKVENVTMDNSKEMYQKYITKGMILNSDGSVASESLEDAFDFDVQKEAKSVSLFKDRKFPIFQADVDGKQLVVAPVVGTGLWGPIWGYVSLESDYSTVYGAVFDHQTETPGLGAEITTDMFEGQFPGKKLMDGDAFKSIAVVKPGTVATTEYNVDGITGGTITSVGVQSMLDSNLVFYNNYFKTIRK